MAESDSGGPDWNVLLKLNQDNGLRVTEVYSLECVHCGDIDRVMVRVGALILCKSCHKHFFDGLTSIPTEGVYYESYKNLLNSWK